MKKGDFALVIHHDYGAHHYKIGEIVIIKSFDGTLFYDTARCIKEYPASQLIQADSLVLIPIEMISFFHARLEP